MKDIANRYPLLTADERFRLFVEAMGRQDEQELDRLESTCPRRNYNSQESEYTRKKMYFTILAFMSELQNLRTDLLAVTALLVAVSIDERGTDASVNTLLDVFRTLTHRSMSKREGWVRFCEGLGVNPTAITTPFIEDAELARRLLKNVAETVEMDEASEVDESDADIVQRELALLNDAWAEVT